MKQKKYFATELKEDNQNLLLPTLEKQPNFFKTDPQGTRMNLEKIAMKQKHSDELKRIKKPSSYIKSNNNNFKRVFKYSYIKSQKLKEDRAISQDIKMKNQRRQAFNRVFSKRNLTPNNYHQTLIKPKYFQYPSEIRTTSFITENIKKYQAKLSINKPYAISSKKHFNIYQ